MIHQKVVFSQMIVWIIQINIPVNNNNKIPQLKHKQKQLQTWNFEFLNQELFYFICFKFLKFKLLFLNMYKLFEFYDKIIEIFYLLYNTD